MFKRAERSKTKLRMTLDGPAGSGKSYTALRFAFGLGSKVAVIDTERGSASKYAGDSPDGIPFIFDSLELTTFNPDRYTEAIEMATKLGYDVLIIDSMSHAWEGKEGILETKQKAGEGWSAWRHVTPLHNRLIDAILQADMHIITTMRSRTEYVQERDEKSGKWYVKRLGMSPVQRPGMEYEFDLVCDLTWDHTMTVSKSRCSAVDGMTVHKPGLPFINLVKDWLDGKEIEIPEELVKEPEVIEPMEVPDLGLSELISQFGIEAIMKANDDKIPGDGDLEKIKAALT